MPGKVTAGSNEDLPNVPVPSPRYLGPMDLIHVDLMITGIVQGVWYRKGACEEANRLGISGYARNLPNGAVSIAAEGEPAAVELFIEWCRKGPLKAHVERVDVTRGVLAHFSGFEVRR